MKSVKEKFVFWLILCMGSIVLVAPIRVMAADCSVTFSWTPNPASENVQGYKVHFGTSQGGPYTETVDIGNPAPVDGRIQWTSSEGFLDNTTYYFVATAYNAEGDGPYSTEMEWRCEEPVESGSEITKIFGESSDSDYTGTVQDTYIDLIIKNFSTRTIISAYTWPTDKPANAIIMKWILSEIPRNAQIKSAKLYLYMNFMENGGGDDIYDVSVHKIINHNPDLTKATGNTYDGINSWTPNTVCYDNKPLAQADIGPAEDVQSIDKTFGFRIWDVTNMVKDWVRNPSANYGMLLNADVSASANSNRAFASSEADDPNIRPKLVITYSTDGSADTTPPGDVTGFTADPGPEQVALSWTNPTDSDFAGVMIRFRTDGTYPQNYMDGTAVPNGNNGKITGSPGAAGSYVHSGLDPNLTYYYSIFTYDTAGNYSHTAHAYATPLPTPPANQAPSISSFSAAPNPADNPRGNINFTVQASDPDGDTLTYTIDFGDGSSSTSGSSVTHAYTAQGTYTAKATVSDGQGHSVDKTLQIEVNDNAPAKVTGVEAQQN